VKLTESLLDALRIVILPSGSFASFEQALKEDILWAREEENG